CQTKVKHRSLPATSVAMRGPIKSAIADGILTFMWIFCASSLGALTLVVSSALGVAQGLPTLVITTLLVFILLFVFGFIGDLLGGATFNPTATAAFYAAGFGGPDSLFSAAIRFPAQVALNSSPLLVLLSLHPYLFSFTHNIPLIGIIMFGDDLITRAAGAVCGALAILEVMPIQYKHMLAGPSLKVDLHTGAIAEGVLTFAITFAVLLIIIRGPRSPIIKNLLLAMSTVSLVVAGASYTGPSMNPANVSYTSPYKNEIPCSAAPKKRIKEIKAFGWAYINNKHNTWEQLYVYWICPFVGAILAAWVFRFLFPPPTKQTKQKKT
ncbi:small basic intrinsic protein 1-2, partial [Striga asiatica]